MEPISTKLTSFKCKISNDNGLDGSSFCKFSIIPHSREKRHLTPECALCFIVKCFIVTCGPSPAMGMCVEQCEGVTIHYDEWNYDQTLKANH